VTFSSDILPFNHGVSVGAVQRVVENAIGKTMLSLTRGGRGPRSLPLGCGRQHPNVCFNRALREKQRALVGRQGRRTQHFAGAG
jgi:hypothetical protein